MMNATSANNPESASSPTNQEKKTEATAKEKCKAILSIWTEKASVSAICRQLSARRPQVERWEALALEGMMRALEARPRGRRAAESVPEGLSSHLEKLLERKLNAPRTKSSPADKTAKSKLENKLDQAEKKIRRGRPEKVAVPGE